MDAGEEVVAVVHPHWWPIAPSVLLLAVVVAGTAWLALAHGGTWVLVALVAVVLVGAHALWRVLLWYSELVVLTRRRVVHQRGILTQRIDDIPLAQVNDLTTTQGLLGRVLGFGRLVIESGNLAGRELVTYVPDPRRVRALVTDLMEQRGRDPLSALERLVMMKMAGLLSEEEFERAKARLLAQGGLT
jgi:membrane protein YdbS with pleckstrin-like domain